MSVLSSVASAVTIAASALLSTNSSSTEELETDLLSYRSILHNMLSWRQSAGPHSSEFNLYDFPAHNFYRILFHFFGGDSDEVGEESTIGTPIGMGYGLLHPSWDYGLTNDTVSNGSKMTEYSAWNYNTAYAYLIMNDEQERAAYLKQFIELLSNISAYSPWYFMKVSGISDALERKQMIEGKYDTLGELTIECLDDSFDHRIGTLLDLYRTAVYSWQLKKEIIPANLRKFDMTIVVFSVPIKNLHHPADSDGVLYDALGMVGDWLSDSDDASEYATTNPSKTSNYITSYKSYEFHNCEINYNKSHADFNDISNEKGFGEKYKIVINYEDMYETRFNEFMHEEITDLVLVDSLTYYYSDGLSDISNISKNVGPGYKSVNANTIASVDPTTVEDELLHSVTGYNDSTHESNLNDKLDESSTSLVDQLLGSVTSTISNKINSVVLGNINGFSLTDSISIGQSIASGNLSGILRAADAITGNSSFSGLSVEKINDNIYDDTTYNPTRTLRKTNIFKSSTLKNS